MDDKPIPQHRVTAGVDSRFGEVHSFVETKSRCMTSDGSLRQFYAFLFLNTQDNPLTVSRSWQFRVRISHALSWNMTTSTPSGENRSGSRLGSRMDSTIITTAIHRTCWSGEDKLCVGTRSKETQIQAIPDTVERLESGNERLKIKGQRPYY
ncbi:hypothetical protein BDV19DRAFT_232136 [Aspergillus venezuelensis]